MLALYLHPEPMDPCNTYSNTEPCNDLPGPLKLNLELLRVYGSGFSLGLGSWHL